MPDPSTPLEPDSPDAEATAAAEHGASPRSDTRAEALLGAADENAPSVPTVLGGLDPEELFARGMNTVKMTASAGAHGWEPPSVEDAARLFPHYEVISLLGRGGMGAVYKARQIELDRLVAIKLLPLEISVDKDFADRFRREARAMAKLHHPNIITVFDFGTTTEGHLFFAMEFVDGANLHAIIHGPGLDPAQTLSITIQVCEALAFAHEQGVIHRDIKPANVMVDQRGRAKVADFGLARLTDPSAMDMGHTMTGTVMGTPDYMAPEQMRGMNVDHRADIYALGVMLYEMLCKDIPRGFFDPPSVRVGADARLDDVVKKAMQQLPERRYQQTTEMKTDVDGIRTTLVVPGGVGRVSSPAAVAASPAREDTRPTPSPRESKLALPLTLAAAVLILGAVAFFALKPKGDTGVPPVKTAQTTGDGWQPLFTDAEWKASVPDKHEYKNGLFHLFKAVSKGQPSADGAIRARIRRMEDSKNETLKIRDLGAANGGYRLSLSASGDSISLVASRTGETTKVSPKLGDAMLPKPLRVGDSVFLELRAQGNHLTGLADGVVLIQTTDDRIKEPGGWGVTAGSGWFESVEVQTLAAPATVSPTPSLPVSASSPPDGWQPLFTEAQWKANVAGGWEFKDGLLHVENFPPNKPHPSPDGAIRARIRFRAGTTNPGVSARDSGPAGPGSYKLHLMTGARAVALTRFPAKGPDRTELGRFTMPKPLQPEDTITLELRVQGDRFTGLVNGAAVIKAQDGEIKSGGTWGIAQVGWYESVEVQPLAASAIAPNLVQTFAGHRYQLVESKGIRWSEAKTKAEALGGHLAVITSAAEEKFAEQLFGAPVTTNAQVWLGATRTKPELKAWSWVTGEPFTFEAWAPQNPNSTVVGDALALMRNATAGTGWNDFEDSEARSSSLEKSIRGFVVEWEDATAAASSPSTATKDAPFVNGLGMKFVPVPITGGPTDGQRVLFSVWETRVQDYEVFAKETKREWPKPDFEQEPTHPAVMVSCEDAQAFCTWLTQRDRSLHKLGADEAYRLPSDHEWSCAVGIGEREDAAKLPNEKSQKIADAFPRGTPWPPPVGAGNYAGEEFRPALAAGKYLDIKDVLAGYGDGFVNTSPVGSFAANRFGLYDLGGNVWQWCEDWFDASQKDRVLRGASWHDFDRRYLLSSYRNHNTPGSRASTYGFRVVLAPANP